MKSEVIVLLILLLVMPLANAVSDQNNYPSQTDPLSAPLNKTAMENEMIKNCSALYNSRGFKSGGWAVVKYEDLFSRSKIVGKYDCNEDNYLLISDSGKLIASKVIVKSQAILENERLSDYFALFCEMWYCSSKVPKDRICKDYIISSNTFDNPNKPWYSNVFNNARIIREIKRINSFSAYDPALKKGFEIPGEGNLLMECEARGDKCSIKDYSFSEVLINKPEYKNIDVIMALDKKGSIKTVPIDYNSSSGEKFKITRICGKCSCSEKIPRIDERANALTKA